MYRRNGKSILLLIRLLSERLRLRPASSARPPQVLRQVLPASSSYARLATDRPNTNKRKQSRVTSKIKETQVHHSNLTHPYSSDLKPTTSTLTPYDAGGEWTTNTQSHTNPL